MAGHPGPYELLDLEESDNAANLVNERSPKMRKDGPDPRLERSEKILDQEPTSPEGLPEATTKRLAPFQYVDAMKVSARLLKLALFDPNAIDLDNRNPRESASSSNMVPTALEKMVSSGPRLGDWAAAPPVDDGRQYGKPPFGDEAVLSRKKPFDMPNPPRHSLAQRVEPQGEVSRMYQPNTLKAASVPSLPVNPGEDIDPLKMPEDDIDEAVRHRVVTDQRINRGSQGGGAAKGATFVSKFLRAAHGR